MGARRDAPLHPASRLLPPVHDPRWLPVAIGHILVALAGIVPHLIILDDAQWADPALWPLLDELRPRIEGAPLLLFVCGRSEELPEAAWESLARWDAAGGLCLRLSGMTEAEIADLAAATGHGPLPPDRLAHIASASGGSPLLALALLHDSDDEALGRPSLAAFFQRRLAGLSAPAAAALVAASALGARFPYDLWAEVAGGQEAGGGRQEAGGGRREAGGGRREAGLPPATCHLPPVPSPPSPWSWSSPGCSSPSPAATASPTTRCGPTSTVGSAPTSGATCTPAPWRRVPPTTRWPACTTPARPATPMPPRSPRSPPPSTS